MYVQLRHSRIDIHVGANVFGAIIGRNAQYRRDFVHIYIVV
jgi:hypothetical protein